jgi:hypothetical protein
LKKILKIYKTALIGEGCCVTRIFEIGPFRLDPDAGLLTRDGKSTVLGPRAVAVLRTLVERAGEYVSKASIIEGQSSRAGRRDPARLHALLRESLSSDELERLLAESAKMREDEACGLALEA